MRVIFMGTPAFAVPSLASLMASGLDVVAVYAQPPRPSGRGHKVAPSPVHAFADAQGLEVRTPLNFKDQDEKDAFAALDADVAVVVAYGLILPKAVLEAPRLGCLNLHGSLLPRWRGAAPIQRAVMAGDRITGVQVMQMARGLDTGPILLSETVPIAADDTAGTLGERMSHIGAELLPRALAALDRGGLIPQPQAEEGVTYAAKIDATEAEIDWSQSAAAIDCHIRGLNPVPGAWTMADAPGGPTRLKLWMSSLAGPVASGAAPGEVMAAGPEGIVIATGDGHGVKVHRLQRPGKAAQDAETFLRGFDLTPGDRLGRRAG